MRIVKKKRAEKVEAAPEPETGKERFLMAVDPGLGGTGWAVLSRKPGKNTPVASGSIEAPENDGWWFRGIWIAEELEHIALIHSVTTVYIELPQFMESAGKGLAAARGGDLVKLSVVTGMVLGRLCDQSIVHPAPVEVREWKGSMPKDVCHKRIMTKLPKGWKSKSGETHEMDAVGLGLFAKGVL